MKLYLKEIGLFLKKYIKSILIGTIAITIIFSAFIMFQNRSSAKENMDTETITENVESTPAYFRFYMKLPDSHSFQNQSLMDEILNSPLAYEMLNDSISFDVAEYFEEPAQVEEDVEEERFRVIDVQADSNSNVFTLIVELGDQDRNLEVLDFYYNSLVNEEFEVLEANEVFIINEPSVFSYDDLESENIEDLSDDYVQTSLIDAWDVIIAVTFALLMMLLVSILREVFNKTLNFSFVYNTGDNYESLLYDKESNNLELVRYFIGTPKHMNKIILSEDTLDKETVRSLEESNEISFREKDSNQIYLKNLTTLSDLNLTADIQEVIIFVYSQKTKREWYKEEIKYSRVLKLPVKTIHFM